MLSEDEAKFKYCPHLTTHDDKLRFCQCSMCMMWRWENPEQPGGRGYCGLADDPRPTFRAAPAR